MTEISSYAFYRSYIKNVFLFPYSIRNIGNCSFALSQLSVSIFTFIGNGAFSNCVDLEAIKIISENPHFKSVDGALFTKDGSKLIGYPSCKKKIKKNHTGWGIIPVALGKTF